MFRFIIAFLFVAVFLILSLPIQGLFFLLGKNPKWKHGIDMASLHIVQWAFKGIELISGAKVTEYGRNNIPTDQPVLFVANHQSFFDVILTYSRMTSLTGYISKDEFAKVPLLPIWMKRLYCLFIDRDDIRQSLQIILTAVDYVKSGVSIFIFPEGTRSRDGQVHEFKKGSFKIAQKTGCPIIPVSIKGTADVFENHFPLLRPHEVTVTYGKPIILSELSDEQRKHIGDHVRDIIVEEA
ncbi:MAG: 1-acyl-sn-glycerol-3-phosphate acyltransferase [Lachnospiraceae bacterium]|nr:1-acyl-sn-glycerol-3-phosphate acyltransferase [Lachnospiraceae bacterium]